jgi:AcrR family transcriptional regulator
VNETSTRGSRQPAVTRERLLQTAEALFLEKGFRATSLQEIADAAGRTTGSIYSSFDGKDDLFLDVFRWRAAKQEAVWREGLREARDSKDAAAAIGKALLLAMPEPAWQAVQFEFISFAARDERLSRETAEIYRRATKLFEEILAHVAESSSLPLERLATILLGLARGLAVTWFVEHEEADPTLFADAASLLLGARALSEG